MPHIVLEHTANIAPRLTVAELFTQIHLQVTSITGVLLNNCKSRRYVTEDFLIGGGGESSAIVHLSIRMIEGRSVETKRQLGESLTSVLRDAFSVSDDDVHVQVTVEVGDIKLDEYSKFPSGSLTPQ